MNNPCSTYSSYKHEEGDNLNQQVNQAYCSEQSGYLSTTRMFFGIMKYGKWNIIYNATIN